MKIKIKDRESFVAAGYVTNAKSKLNFFTREGVKNVNAETGRYANNANALTLMQVQMFLGKSHELVGFYIDDYGNKVVQVKGTHGPGGPNIRVAVPLELTSLKEEDFYLDHCNLPVLGRNLVRHKCGIHQDKMQNIGVKILESALVGELKKLAKFLGYEVSKIKNPAPLKKQRYGIKRFG